MPAKSLNILRNLLTLAFGVTLALASLPFVRTAEAVSTSIVISEVYGGGGNAGSTYKNDYIELYNLSGSAVDLTGFSVQYTTATGITWQVTPIAGTLAASTHYLIQEAAGTGGTTNLPTPEAIGTIIMAATAGKVALVNTTVALSGACPSGAQIIDLVGYGLTASCFEGTGPTPAPSNTTAAIRAGGGATETDNNSTDFATGAPDPDNSSTDTAPFTDDPLLAGSTVIKAFHLGEVRDSVNDLRVSVGLKPVVWTDIAASGLLIKAAHIIELRNALTPALTALGRTASYSDPSLAPGDVVKAVHIQEIRDYTR